MKLLIKDISIVPMTAENHIIANGYLEIKDSYIQAVAGGEPPVGQYDHIVDGTDLVALPGFINSHTLAAMTLLRGYADDMPLM
ncbi:MAG: N-ethylammeline chlorohydrolase, partial [Syntrophomonas sp.]|nr:N-ethylammeline chlorohydrolase [Syntrophomonas sp.]